MSRVWFLRAMLFLAFLAYSTSLHTALSQYAEDDAFIHIRIARNLALFGLPYFNLDSPVSASSAPLWTMVLAGVIKLVGDDTPTIVSALTLCNSWLLVLASFLLGQLLHSTGSIRSFLLVDVLAALVIFSFVSHSSVGLMESPLAVTLFLGSLLLFAHHKEGAALLCAILAAAVRPEFSILVIASGYVVFTRRVAWREIAPATLVGLLLVAYQLLFFRTLIPHTVKAKSLIYSLSWTDALQSVGAQYLYALPYALSFSEGVAYAWMVSVFLVLIFALASALRTYRADHTAAPLGAIALVVGGAILSLYVARGVLLFPWYIPIYSVPLAVGTLLVFMRMTPLIRWPAILFLLAAPTYSLWGTSQAALSNPARYYSFLSGARVRQYRTIAARLDLLYPDKSILAPEIGGVGAEFHGAVRDACGLASPEALKYHPMQIPDERRNGAECGVPPGLVVEAKPDIIVAPRYLLKAVEKSGMFERYSILEVPIISREDSLLSGETEVWGERSILVLFDRRTIVAPRL